MQKQIRWGFIGAGRISHRFIDGFRYTDCARVESVYARNPEQGKAFCEQYNIPYYYDDIDEFLDSGNFDVVYIALPHQAHMDVTIKALEKKIPVLCEKPMAPNLGQVTKIKDAAKKNDTFAMEAMWTRYFPVTKKILAWIAEDKIGTIRGANGTFSYLGDYDPKDRLFSMDQAGGALLDIGVYLIAYMSMIFKDQPLKVTSLMRKAGTGVDGTNGIVFQYDTAIATLLTSLEFSGEDTMTIYGTKGRIEVASEFWRPTYAKLITEGTEEEIKSKHSGEGYQFEIEHVSDCIHLGKKESEDMTLWESVGIAETIQQLRDDWGLVYPFEKE